MEYGKAGLESIFEITELYTAFYHKYKENYSFVGETHNFWEIVLVLEGQIGVTAGRDVMVLGKGQAVLHEPMEFHRLWSEGNSKPLIAIFSFSCRNMPELKSRLFKIGEAAAREAVSLIDSMRKIFVANGVSIVGIQNPAALDHQLVLKNLEIFILGVLSENITKLPKPKSQSAKNYSAIIKLLENNVTKNLKISDMAKMCNMSEINLKKTFNKYAGIGIKAYFNRLKMNEAISLLRSGTSVTETAAYLGYTDQNYFSAAFKKIVGRPPSYYRK